MNIATIRGMVEKDLKIDSTELDLASLRIPQLHNKYLNNGYRSYRRVLKGPPKYFLSYTMIFSKP